jgi:hypothetical protein
MQPKLTRQENGQAIANKLYQITRIDDHTYKVKSQSIFTIKNPRTRHIAHARIKGDHNNHKMERMNVEIRNREGNERVKEGRYTQF